MKNVIKMSIFAIALVLVGAGSMAAQTSSVAGEWDATMNTPGGPRPFKLVFSVNGEKLTGTAKRSNGDVAIVGTVKGDDISFSYTINYNNNDITLTFTGKVKGDSMGGSVSFGGNAEDEWAAKRTPPAKPKTE